MGSLRVPEDVEEMTREYLKGETGGICGQSCLAVIEEMSIKKVLENYKSFGMEFKGWSPWKELRQYLERQGYSVKLLRKQYWGDFKNTDYLILRIQWIGDGDKKDKPFYGWSYWTEASCYTHFVVWHDGEYFCNECGLFKDIDSYLQDAGVVTSIMRITKHDALK